MSKEIFKSSFAQFFHRFGVEEKALSIDFFQTESNKLKIHQMKQIEAFSVEFAIYLFIAILFSPSISGLYVYVLCTAETIYQSSTTNGIPYCYTTFICFFLRIVAFGYIQITGFSNLYTNQYKRGKKFTHNFHFQCKSNVIY